MLDGNVLASLPASVGKLTALKLLSCNGNRVASLPASIGALSSLEALELSGNALRVLPDAIAALTALEALDLEENPLVRPQSDVVEAWLQSLRESGCDVLLDVE